MEMTLCLDERFCQCGSEFMIEYEGETNADSAVTKMWDELHHGPDCGPVSPQMAAIARSKMTHRELQHRRNRENRVQDEVRDERLPRESYDMLFPDSTGIRAETIAGALRALEVPHGIRLRARDAWVEITVSPPGEGGIAMLRLLCKIGGPNRAVYYEGIEALRAIPGYLGDNDEEFNDSYASFWFTLPETLSPDVRAAMTAQAPPIRNLTVEARQAKEKFAAMGASA